MNAMLPRCFLDDGREHNPISLTPRKGKLNDSESLGLPYLGQKGFDFRENVNFDVIGATGIDIVFFDERVIASSTNYSLGVQLELFKQLLPAICHYSSTLKTCCGGEGRYNYNLTALCGSEGARVFVKTRR
ncbi:hypothetical protein GIB67_028582 [Kingdonia uniflora]|uniref:Uncharacterized protein n=1 Tax=Kingdonia uniflora TaxID=39325 RepID=A0A7J7KZD1_9MAGN|nr:hypothetical protein GIB67_028582 [Kingdonia uniflora]